MSGKSATPSVYLAEVVVPLLFAKSASAAAYDELGFCTDAHLCHRGLLCAVDDQHDGLGSSQSVFLLYTKSFPHIDVTKGAFLAAIIPKESRTRFLGSKYSVYFA